MPLGDNLGDKSDSRYCGVETEFNDDMPHVLSHNINGGFDFVVAPLVSFLSFLSVHFGFLMIRVFSLICACCNALLFNGEHRIERDTASFIRVKLRISSFWV